MKEDTLEVLMYLFEHYFDDEVVLGPEQESIKLELVEAGFTEGSVVKAFSWLEGLASQHDSSLASAMSPGPSTRIFSAHETSKLGVDGRGFLLTMEQLGVLDPVNRELVIDRIMALESEEIDLEQIKWVLQMVLYNQPGSEAAFAWMGELMADDGATPVH